MDRSSLTRLLAPRSIALIGGAEAREALRQCERIGFAGPIWMVHPSRKEIAGRPCYASVADLPAAPDAAFVAIPRAAAVEAIAELAARGAGGAVCYASGFAEADAEGARLERELVARSGAMALTGPNCFGVLNYLDGAALWPDQHGGTRVARGVAVVTQSGNIGLNLTMQNRSLPLAYLISVGNKAKGDFGAYVDALLDDERVTAIGLHIEGLSDIAGFARAAARARERRVPIVVVKTGRSAAGAALTMSHTSSLAGPDALYDALFARLGVARAADLTTFLETLKLLHVGGPLPGRRISSMSCSGGEASLVADLAEDAGLETPALPSPARAALEAALGPRVPVANPLDYHTYIWADLAAQTACFSAMLAAGYDINLLVLDFPRADRCDGATWDITLDAFAAAITATGARGAVVATLPECLPEAVAKRLVDAGVGAFAGLSEAFNAIRLATAIGEAWARPAAAAQDDVPAPSGFASNLDEDAAKSALAAFGLARPAGGPASAAEAPGVAEALGFPVVVKALDAALAHKTEAGAVRLNLRSRSDVQATVAAMTHLSSRFLIERMVEGAVAELIVGVTRGEPFGLALTIGAGGVLVELLDDSATLLLPATRADIDRALRSLRCFPLMDGYRGRPSGDVEAAVDAILAVARYAEANARSLVELDVNPLLVLPAGAVAVDALIRLAEGATP
jgi:acyl-CoA synthetase (NDP forming)